jgi:glucose/arabinose dehydrogenase
LPPPSSNVLAINEPHIVNRPANAQPKVPPGFKIELYATGFRDPRFLLTAPNGDIFVVESHANQIKVLRDTNSDGKPDVTETFADRSLNKPFGIAFYPPGNDPQFLYVANTDGVIRFPYRNGDPKARGPAQKLAHSASLNLCFYTGEQFPAEYKGDIFAAFQGSWNRMKPTGYKVVRVPFDKSSGKARGDYQDFVTGFITPEGKVWGRPVGITVAKDGSLLVSEDGEETMWRVSYKR